MDARSIVAALGGRWSGSSGATRCPSHADRTPSLSVTERDGRVLVKCHAGCAQSDVLDALRALGLWAARDDDAPRPKRRLRLRVVEPDPERAARVASIVAECRAIDGTPADLYLRHRAIDARPLPDCIRWRPHAWRMGGALVALATDDAGAVRAIQEIYINDAGRKAGLDVAKRTHGTLAGAVVRLPGSPGLVLAEGVEDALTLWQAAGRETWACLGVANIAKAPVPRGAAVVIAADNDPKGSPAWNAIADAERALFERGHDVAIRRPPARFKDWNDWAAATRENVVALGGRTPHAA